MARVARRRNRPRVARRWTHLSFPRKMTPRPLQPHFPPERYARGGALRASALRAEGTHLCELSDNHCNSAATAPKYQRRPTSRVPRPPAREAPLWQSSARVASSGRRHHDGAPQAWEELRTIFERHSNRLKYFTISVPVYMASTWPRPGGGTRPRYGRNLLSPPEQGAAPPPARSARPPP